MKNVKRIEREKAIAAIPAPEGYPLKEKYRAGVSYKVTKAGRSNNSGSGKRGRSWGPYPEPHSPWNKR